MTEAEKRVASGDADGARRAFADVRRHYLEILKQPAHIRLRKDLVEEALYFAGVCCEKLKEQEADGLKQAIEHWVNLVRQFPNGGFSAHAEKDLQRVGYRPADEKPQP